MQRNIEKKTKAAYRTVFRQPYHGHLLASPVHTAHTGQQGRFRPCPWLLTGCEREAQQPPGKTQEGWEATKTFCPLEMSKRHTWPRSPRPGSALCQGRAAGHGGSDGLGGPGLREAPRWPGQAELSTPITASAQGAAKGTQVLAAGTRLHQPCLNSIQNYFAGETESSWTVHCWSDFTPLTRR